MTVNFPSSPSQGDTYTYEAITYTFDGEKWVGSTASSFNDVTISGASANVILQGNDSITTDQTFTFNDQGGKLVPYQQGLWVPTMDNGTNTDNPGQNVWYRIGNYVTLHGFLNDWTDITTATAITVLGLPYSLNFNQAAGSVMATRCAIPVHTTFISASSQGILFYESADSTANSWAGLTYSGTNTATQIRFQATYLTDDTTWTPINGATVS